MPGANSRTPCSLPGDWLSITRRHQKQASNQTNKRKSCYRSCIDGARGYLIHRPLDVHLHILPFKPPPIPQPFHADENAKEWKQKHYTFESKTRRLLGRHKSQALTWNEDEEAAQSYCDHQEHEQDRQGASCERLLHKRFPDLVEIEESILAITRKSNDGVEHVLVGEYQVYSNGEGENNLQISLVDSYFQVRIVITYPAPCSS